MSACGLAKNGPQSVDGLGALSQPNSAESGAIRPRFHNPPTPGTSCSRHVVTANIGEGKPPGSLGKIYLPDPTHEYCQPADRMLKLPPSRMTTPSL